MSKPQPITITIWITVAGFCLTIAAIVFASGGEKQRIDNLQAIGVDHESRIRMLESKQADVAVMKLQIEDMSRKIDQVHSFLMRTPREETTR